MTRSALIAGAATCLLTCCGPAYGAERGIVLGRRAFGPVACGAPVVKTVAFADPARLAGADPAACRILLNRDYARQMPADMRCTLVLHEYGHLAGRGHSGDPDSVMYREYVRADRRCAARFSAESRRAPRKRRRARGTSGSAPGGT